MCRWPARGEWLKPHEAGVPEVLVVTPLGGHAEFLQRLVDRGHEALWIDEIAFGRIVG